MDPLCLTNVTTHIISLTVPQIITDLCQDSSERFHLFLTTYFHETCRNIIAFQTSPLPGVAAEKQVQKLLEAPLHVHACTHMHGYLYLFSSKQLSLISYLFAFVALFLTMSFFSSSV